jgi:hypothetical protein
MTELTVGVAAVAIGAGATATMDLWAALLWRCCRVASLDMALLGRWIGHFPRGRFRHASIGRATPVKYERTLGRLAHYGIGIAFAALLLAFAGTGWLRRPTLLPALAVSWITLAAPWLVMQPAMGAGVASSRAPRPNAARLRSVATHTIYGVGLYLSAWIWTAVVR